MLLSPVSTTFLLNILISFSAVFTLCTTTPGKRDRTRHLRARHKRFRAEDLPDTCGVLQVHVRAFSPTCRTKRLQLLLK